MLQEHLTSDERSNKMASEKGKAGCVTPQNTASNRSEKLEDTVNKLRSEIKELKKKLADKDELIDYLHQAGYEESEELKLKLADAWNIALATNAEKVSEVNRIIRCNEENKCCAAAVKYLVDDHVEVEENADELTDEQIKPDAVCDKEDIQVSRLILSMK